MQKISLEQKLINANKHYDKFTVDMGYIESAYPTYSQQLFGKESDPPPPPPPPPPAGKDERQSKIKSVTVDTGQDAEDVLLGFIKGDISKDILKNIGGQSLVNKAGRIKDAYKGEYAGRKKYKGKPVSDIGNLKELKYGSYKDKYSWDDVVGEIYDTKQSGASILEDYLGDNISINNLNLAYRTRREGAEKIKKDFEKLGITISEYKDKYPNKYNKLVNILSKASLKKG